MLEPHVGATIAPIDRLGLPRSEEVAVRRRMRVAVLAASVTMPGRSRGRQEEIEDTQLLGLTASPDARRRKCVFVFGRYVSEECV
jgi:hypothetical protein